LDYEISNFTVQVQALLLEEMQLIVASYDMVNG